MKLRSMLIPKGNSKPHAIFFNPLKIVDLARQCPPVVTGDVKFTDKRDVHVTAAGLIFLARLDMDLCARLGELASELRIPRLNHQDNSYCYSGDPLNRIRSFHARPSPVHPVFS
jgi:hypothetical protein